MKVVAFLPVKGSSSRVPNKNMRLLDGKPLFLHTLEKLAACSFLDEVYLDTESDEVISCASEVNCKIMHRDPSLASNKTDGNVLFLNEVKHVEADIYVQILATSPFISTGKIKEGVDALIAEEKYDSAALIRKERLYTWRDGSPSYDIQNIPNSVDLEDTLIETMGLYVVRREAALSLQRRIGEKPYLIEASVLDAIDVNWPEDFELANLIAAGRREQDRRLLGNLRIQLTSSMLSDLLDDLGYPNQIVKGLNPNIVGSKLLGRAKTLKLRVLEEGEEFSGIYGALASYETIVPNDIIVVENEASEYAYFGELNANLAIRAGASGVIVNGMTRDSSEVRATGLPVYARGNSCQDVRKRAALDSINKTIVLDGVEVSPSCLVFADAEGIVIIPRSIEKEVMKEVYIKVANEKKILVDISAGRPLDELTKNHGFF